jgi:hypothetical protein
MRNPNSIQPGVAGPNDDIIFDEEYVEDAERAMVKGDPST